MLQAGTVVSGAYYNTSDTSFRIFNNNGGLRFDTSTVNGALSIASTGIATFTSTITPLIIRGTNVATMWTEYYYNTSTLSGYIGSGDGLLSGANASDFIVRSQADFVVATGGNNRRLTIASTGAATFSSSVTAGGSVYVGGPQSTSMSNIYGASNYIYYTQSSASAIQVAGTNTVTNGSIVITNAGGTGAYSIIGNAGLASGYGLYIQSQDRTAASYYPLLLQPNGGNVGIGTSSPTAKLEIYDNTNSGTLRLTRDAGQQRGQIQFGRNNGGSFQNVAQIIGDSDVTSVNNGVLSFWTSNSAGSITERMRITSGGNVLIGTTTDTGQSLRIYQPTNGNWNIKLSQPNSSSINYQEFLTTTNGDATVTARGSITYNGTNVLYNGTSDYRLKEDLKLFNGLELVSKLKTYDFKWKEAGTRDYGMMAHELQEVLPNYVTGKKDEINEDGSIKPQGVDYSKIVPVLVKAIQEQQAQIEELKALINK